MGVEPVIYGSLGLYLLLRKSARKRLKINDIDFLLKDSDFDNKWNEIEKFLERSKCEIDPKHKFVYIFSKDQ